MPASPVIPVSQREILEVEAGQRRIYRPHSNVPYSPLTWRILDALQEILGADFKHLQRPTVRTQFFMPGEHPWGRRGWHTDYQTLKSRQRYLFVSGPPLTEFLWKSNVSINGGWGDVDREANLLPKFSIEPNRLITYDDDELHRGVPATSSGWRYFFRAILI